MATRGSLRGKGARDVRQALVPELVPAHVQRLGHGVEDVLAGGRLPPRRERVAEKPQKITRDEDLAAPTMLAKMGCAASQSCIVYVGCSVTKRFSYAFPMLRESGTSVIHITMDSNYICVYIT